MSKSLTTPSKLRHPPHSVTELPKSPYRLWRHSDHFSGLWECYYDNLMGEVGERGGGGEGGDRLKNIRGFLFKRRKSPLKGWNKRYFVLERGTLYSSRSLVQLQKGKLLGSIDLGMAVITCDGSSRRIDIDAEHQVYHLKTKNASHFAAWSSCLVSHEMYRKTQLVGTGGGTVPAGGGMAWEEMEGEGIGLGVWATQFQDTVTDIKKDMDEVRQSLEAMSVFTRPHSRAPSCSSTGSEMKGLESSDTVPLQSQQSNENGSWGRKRKGRKKQKGKESTSNLSPDQAPLAPPTFSVPSSLSSPLCEDTAPMECNILKDDFSGLARNVLAQFWDSLEKLERIGDGLQKALQHEASVRIQQQTSLSNQQQLLRQAVVQNSELRDRLSQIQALALGIEPPAIGTPAKPPRRTPSQSIHRLDSIMSVRSVRSSISDKFFDALDDFHDGSTESEDEGENTATEEDSLPEEEESDTEMFSLTADVLSSLGMSPPTKSPLTKMASISEDALREMKSHDRSHDLGTKKRRNRLPSPIVEVRDFSLWSILRKNIGKDLSKISMPVTLNEPLSALQRLCEELEYSELLDQAAGLADPHDRMVRVAAFAVSAYALSFYRAGRKPFNPVLGETYECVREDKGFHFIAEQVSHHPPIAACHCESPHFVFWQDARIKSKFWGKSMEVFPIGTVNVKLPKHGDHYQWQKVTSCIHNVLGGQRWVDQYGEMVIRNKGRCSCKLTFIKASYWSSKKYIVHGDVYDSEGQKVRHLFGTWNEAMFCGDPEDAQYIWSVAPMLPDHEQYYGFSLFATELNELEEDIKDKLPWTDCRFRPDQRLLEEGKVEEAEAEKHRVEQIQREARAERERLGIEWLPNFFSKEIQEDSDQECWVYKGNYWSLRESHFSSIKLPNLW